MKQAKAFVGEIPEKFSKRKGVPKLPLIIVAVIAGSIGAYAILHSFAATPAKTLYLATNGSDSASCTQAAPCASFNRAYQVADLGDTVEVAAGTYGGQQINEESSKEVDGDPLDVVFKPAAGANVTVGSISSHASHITIQDMKITTDVNLNNYDPIKNSLKLTDITLKNLDGRNFNIFSANHVNILGGDWGPASDCGGPYGGSNNSIRRPGSVGPNPDNIMIDGVTIHDIQTYNKDSCHMEGLAIFAGTNITVKNSKFYGNSIYDIFLQSNSGPISNITFENNWFATTTGQAYASGGGASAVAFSGSSGDFANTTLRHNSFNDIVSFDDNGVNPSYVNFKVVGNIGVAPFGLCSLHMASGLSYNVWKNQACNSTERNLNGAALPYVNPSNDASMDYHLKAGSVAIDLVPTSASGVAIDFDCGARPVGPANDAGADEYTSTGVCIGSSTTNPPPPTGDTTAPTVSMTAPANNATVSGTTAVSATASDDTAVTGVQFKLDGNNLSSEDTTSPYSIDWNTTGTANGSHSLTAVARDAAGNTATATTRTVTVNNTTSSGSGKRYVSSSGSDSGNNCLSQSSPCLSFDRAYSQAALGDTVEVAGGTYGGQTINYVNQSPKNTSSDIDDVVFKPAAGASVTINGDINVYGFHVTIQDMSARDTNIPYDGPVAVHDVTFKNMDARNFTIDSGVHISILGGDYGPASSCGGPDGGGNNGIRKNNNTMPSDILISGVNFHDVQSYDLINCHIECLIIGAGDGLTIENSKFRNCSIFDIFLQPFNGAISNVLIQNNWFAVPTDQNGSPNSGRAVEFSTRSPWNANWNNVTIRNNSFNTALNVDDDTSSSYSTYTNFKVTGNILERSSDSANTCNSSVQYNYNVWKNSGCGSSTDVSAGGTYPYVNAAQNASFDYHLKPGGNVAVDLVPANQAPSTDIDGKARPHGAAADAGSDESASIGSADTTAPSVSFTSPTNGSTVSGIVTATANASDDTGVTKVDISLDGVLKMQDNAAPYNYSFDSKTLSNGSHTLKAQAYDAAGNTSTTTITVTVSNPDITPPNAPTNLNATASSPTAVNLTWNAASDTGANQTGVVKYNVLRNGVVIAQPTTTSYSDTNNLTANTTYSYTIQAVDGAGNVSANSTADTATTPAAPADTTPPTVPTGLAATAVSVKQVNLAWDASTDSGSGVAGYNVYRGGTKLNSTPVTTTSYGDSTASSGTTYSYKVEAIDGAGNKSAQTTAVSVTTPQSKRGDIAGPTGAPDGRIDIFDLSYLIRNFNTTDPNADVSGSSGSPDGKVDIFDLSYIISKYGG